MHLAAANRYGCHGDKYPAWVDLAPELAVKDWSSLPILSNDGRAGLGAEGERPP